LSIGLALIGNPDVLILDEPHNGLNNDGMAILKSIIEAKSKDHIIILIHIGQWVFSSLLLLSNFQLSYSCS